MMTQGETADERPRAGWRLYVGASFFVLSLVSPVFIPLVTATSLSASVKTTLSGALVVGIP